VSGSGVEAMGEGRWTTGEMSEDHEFWETKISGDQFLCRTARNLNSTHIKKYSH
jgi:hypothetical protein